MFGGSGTPCGTVEPGASALGVAALAADAVMF